MPRSYNNKFRLIKGGAGIMAAVLEANTATRLAVQSATCENEEVFFKELSETGNTLKALFRITPGKIKKALEEVREEWK